MDSHASQVFRLSSALLFALLAIGLTTAQPAAAQSISGTVFSESEWENDESLIPPHWHVNPEGGTMSNGQGRIIVELYSIFGSTEYLSDKSFLVPPNSTGSVTLASLSLPAGTNYLLGAGLAAGTYQVRAWIDGNGDNNYDLGEPFGMREVTVSGDSSATHMDVTINDDTDVDGLEDWWEVHWFGDLEQTRSTDYDNDGLSDGEEYDLINSNLFYVAPNDWDTDSDGLDDAWELFYGLDPTSNSGDDGQFGDPDGDTLSNIDEYKGADGIGWRTDANDNGIAEFTTSRDAMNPTSTDSDQDGVSDDDELLLDLTHPTHSMSSTNFYPRSLEMSVNGSAGTDITDPSGIMYAFGSLGGTVEFWVYPETDGDGIIYEFTNRVVNGVTNDIVGDNLPHFRISLEDFRPKMEILSGSNVMASVGGVGAEGSVQQLESNAWSHVACVIAPENNSLDLYVDGVLLIAQKTFIKPNLVLGRPTICRDFSDGYLDELRIWNYPRASADVEYWATRYYPAPGYVQQWAATAGGRLVQMYKYSNPQPLLGYFRFDDGGPSVENYAFINYGLYPNDTPYYLPASVAAAVSSVQAVPMTGSDDADGDGLPEWWVELHNLEQYEEYYSTIYGPFSVACPDNPAYIDGFEFYRSFVAYGSVGNAKSLQEPGGITFHDPKTRPEFFDGDRSSFSRYVYLFTQPIECPLSIYTPGMLSTIIYVNGTRVTTDGDEANTVQSYDVAQYMQIGRNQIHVECESLVERSKYSASSGAINGTSYTVSDYQAYDSSLSDEPIGCDENPYEFRVALGKFDAELHCNGVPMIVRGDESRADPRAVWHCQVWSEFYERISHVPHSDRESRAVPENPDYGVPLNAEQDNNPLDPESQNDALDAVYEFICKTNPRDRDSNNNGVGDGDEDFDADGLVNREEQRFGSDPWLPDTDDDGLLDGSDVGSDGHPAQSLSPQNNMSLRFGGSQDDYLSFPKQQRFALSKWTVEGWIKPDADEADGGIVMQRSVASNAVNYEVGLTAANTPYARYVSIGGGEVRVDTATPVTADGSNWTHVAASYYDRTLVLYVNGTNVASTTGSAFPALHAGGPVAQQIGRGFKGCIDELRLWGDDRSGQEIVDHRDEVLTGLETTLVAYYRFDDNTSYTNLPPVVGSSANNGTNGASATVAWAWGQVEDNVLRYAADWQSQWEHAASFNGAVSFSTDSKVVGPPRLQVYIDPDDAIDAGAAWSYNGGAAWNESGHLESRLSPGTYEINFKEVEGWIEPDLVEVTLVRGESTIVTSRYVQTASLTVIIDNNTQVKTHATWSIDGGVNNNGTGARVDGLSPGLPGYDIIFSDISEDVPGWDRPSTIHVELSEAEERTVTAEYTPVFGSLQITFTPAEAPSSARWRVSGDTNWFGSGEIATNLAYGNHTVEYNEVEWWKAPDNETIFIESSSLLPLEREWTKLPEPTSITAVLVPSNVVLAGAQWRMNETLYTSGDNAIVEPGTYTVGFTDVPGYLTPSDITTLADGSSVTVTGTYYRAEVLGEPGALAQPGVLLNPRGVAVSGDFVYVADSGHDCVQVYEQSISAWSMIGRRGTGAGEFRQPFAVAVVQGGQLWVADTGNHRLQRRDASSGAWEIVGGSGSAVGQFNAPYDVVVDRDGNVYVADHYNSRVQKRLTSGEWSVIIPAGSEPGRVRSPGALHLGIDGMLYVSDYDGATGVARVQRFARTGEYQATVGSSAADGGLLGHPMGAMLMGNGDLLVADAGADSVLQNTAAEWSYFIRQGALDAPRDVVADIWGNLFIADTGNGRVLRMPARDTDGDGIPDVYEDPIPQGVSIYPVLEVNDNLEVFRDAGGVGSFVVIANGPWVATSDATWVQIQSGGTNSGSSIVEYMVLANGTGLPRRATITVTGGGLTRTHVASQPVPTIGNDFTGIGRSDMGVFDRSTGRWFIRDVTGAILASPVNWGWPGVQAVGGDFDADGTDDLSVFDPVSGTWFIRSASGSVILANAQWGWSGVEALSGDYNGDGADDLAVFDQNTGRWFVRSVDGATLVWSAFWGWTGVQPIAADFDGDMIADLGVFDRQSGRWYIRTVSGETLAWSLTWGWAGSDAVLGDYDGDGADDLAIFDQVTGAWFIRTLDGTQIAWNVQWGWPGVRPVSGDFDGDGRHDLAIVDEATGRWFVRSLTAGTLVWNEFWGWDGVQPVGR